MKYLISLSFLLFLLVACNEKSDGSDDAKKLMEHHEQVYQSISKKWQFNFPKAKPEIETTLQEWQHWQQFQNELQQQPKTSMFAFQMKIENVAKRSDSLSLNVPERFNNPQVRSRLITLNTQLNSLDTYMHLSEIPEEKVLGLISAVNKEISSIYMQLDEIVIKEKIPMEIGEADMIRALDTTRLANEKLFEENLQKTDSLEKPTPKENRKQKTSY